MVTRRRRINRRVRGGFFQFEGEGKRTVYGTGDADLIRLRDEFGNTWWGQADQLDDNLIRYRFHDDQGNIISGLSDNYGILLRDPKGKTWRGYVL
ncbi:MAG: hypothetical protein ACRD44_11075 [Bryobacteraceae bacterium]